MDTVMLEMQTMLLGRVKLNIEKKSIAVAQLWQSWPIESSMQGSKPIVKF